MTDGVKRNATVDPDIAYAVGSVYALEGDAKSALEWLKRSIALGNGNKPCFEGDPNLKRVRDDSHFAEMMRRISQGANQS